MIRRTALLLTLLLGGSAHAATPSIGPWERMPNARAVKTDGTRWALIDLGRQRRVVQDTTTGRSRTEREPPCFRAVVAVGAGRIAWDCNIYVPTGHRLVIEDLRTGARGEAAGLPALIERERQSADGARFAATSVGRDWVLMLRRGYHYSDHVLVGIRRPGLLAPPLRSDVVVDPDRIDGERPLCSGIRQPPGNLDAGDFVYRPLRYVPPFAIGLASDGQPGRLYACHDADLPAAGTTGAQIGGGIISWEHRGNVLLRAAVGRRVVRRKAPGLRVLDVQHTRSRIYVTVRSGKSATAIFRARIH